MDFCFKNCNFTNLLYCLDTIGVITIFVHLNRTKKILVSFWSKFRHSGWKVWKTVLYRIAWFINLELFHPEQRNFDQNDMRYSEKYVWLRSFFYFQFQCYWQDIKSSTDLEQQLSAAFKADNSRQVQTC